VIALLVYLVIEFRRRQPTLEDEIEEILAPPEPPRSRSIDRLRDQLHGPTAASSGGSDMTAAVANAIAALKGKPPGGTS
jgi:hypothetical protein